MIAKCKYKLADNSLKFNNIEELYKYLDETKEYASIEDVIYSKEASTQDIQEENLRKIKQINLKPSSNDIIEEEFKEEGESGEFSIGNFLDFSEEAKINGNRIYTPLNVDDFKSVLKKEYTSKGITEEQADILIQNEIDHWKQIEQLAISMHKLGISKFIGGSSESESKRRAAFLEQAKDILPENSYLNDDKLLINLFDQLSKVYQKIKSSDSKAIRGLNVTAQIQDSDTKLFGKIDYAVIDSKGNLHIYNFKVSSQFYTNWSKEKREKYNYEAAFIKQMLAANGIDINNITLHFIPVHTKFSKDFKTLESVQIHDAVNIEYKGSSYIATKYDNVAKYFIKPKVKIAPLKFSEHLENRKILNAIFPTQQIDPDMINKSAKEWIKSAPSSGDEFPLTITEINDGQHRYSVRIDGKVHLISDFTKKENNKEILKLVSDYIAILNQDAPNYVNIIADAIEHTFKAKLEFWDFKNIKNAAYLETMLRPYLSYTTEITKEGKEIKHYDWEFIDSLVDSGIFIFRNRESGQLDTVTITSKNLKETPEFNYGTNILGGYLTDRQFGWKGFYGNIESVRTLIMLNSRLKDLPKDTKLGNQHIISYRGMHMQYPMEHVVKNYLPKIIETTEKFNPDIKIKNNFGNIQYVDQFESLVNQFVSITSSADTAAAIMLKETVDVEELKSATNNEQKARALLSILEAFQESHPDIANNPQLIIKENRKSYAAKLANFYIKASQAYLYYKNTEASYEEELTLIERYIYTAPTVPNRNINIVVTNLQATIDSIASDSDEEYSKNLRSFIMEFYKDAGYTSFENMTLGDQARLYENMYELDEIGDKTMRFKNPYTDPSLKEYERKFLKKALFYFNKYNFYKGKQKFLSPEDPDIQNYILQHPEYLNVPLERASNSTRRQRGASDRISRIKRTFNIIFKNKGQDIYDEFVEGLTSEERKFLSQNLDQLRLQDSFNRTEQQRASYIAENGIDYFETNIENLLIDRMFGAIQTEKMNRMLIGTKALLLQLELLGENSGFEDTFNKEIEHIKKYIGLNVFKKPIIEKGLAQTATGLGMKVRSKVTFLNLAGNVISAARDTMNGFMENYLRTVSGYQTNISKSNMTKAYAYVVTHDNQNAMAVNLLSKLCVRYRLSNTDTARITERLRSNRQGISNWDNIAYSTLRGPDFLNRMTLFVGKAMEDGVFDAWSINKNDELVYNWKKDKRFSLLADKSKKDTKEYKEQQALYALHIKEWNKDHPESEPLTIKDDLPTPYSDQEIIAIKNVSNNIYGSYDKSLRSMSEFTSLGVFFGMYTTWMNGIWNNWMMKPGKYNVHKMLTEQETDIDGSLLWLDENGQITKENTGVPCLKHVPVIVQGVIPTLQDAVRIMHKKGFTAAYQYIMEDENTKTSIAHMGESAFIGLLLFLLLNFLLTPEYENTKKGFKDMNTISVLLTDLGYKSFKPAVDSFYGPINIIQYLGNGTNPPVYNVPTKFITDGYKTLFGNKTVGQFVTGNFALLRIGKNVANVAAKS